MIPSFLGKNVAEREKAGLPDPQNLLDLSAIDLPIVIRLEQIPQLVVRKSLVTLSYGVLLGEDYQGGFLTAILESDRRLR